MSKRPILRWAWSWQSSRGLALLQLCGGDVVEVRGIDAHLRVLRWTLRESIHQSFFVCRLG